MMLKKKAIILFILSLIFPGLGQMYNGQLKKGILFSALRFILPTILLLFITWYSNYKVLNITVLSVVILLSLYIAGEALLTCIKHNSFQTKNGYKWYWYFVFIIITGVINTLANSTLKDDVIGVFKLPTPSMEHTLLLGDFILADLSFYKHQKPVKNDVIIFTHYGTEKKPFTKRIVAESGQTIQIDRMNVKVNGNVIDEPQNVFYMRDGKIPYYDDIFIYDIPEKGDTFSIKKLSIRDFMFLFYIAKQEHQMVQAQIVLIIEGKKAVTINLGLYENWYQVKDMVNEIVNRCKVETKLVSMVNLLRIGGENIDAYTVENKCYFVLGDNRDNSLNSRFYGCVSRKSISGKVKLIYFSRDRRVPFWSLHKSIRWKRIGMPVY